MSWRPHGRATINLNSVSAWGICDRCGFLYVLKELVFQQEYRGNELVNTGFRVCTVTCLDVPFQQNRPLFIPPDPTPVDQPRVEQSAIEESGPAAWDQPDTYWDSGLVWDPKETTS